MFTGIIQEIGVIERILPGQAFTLRIRAAKVLDGIERGDSISVDGTCLTVVDFDKKGFDVDAIVSHLLDHLPGQVVGIAPVEEIGG